MANIITRCAGFKFIISLHEYIYKKKLLPKDVYIQTFLCSKQFCIKLKYAGLVVAAAAVLRSLRRRRLLQANSSMNFFKTFFISQKILFFDFFKTFGEIVEIF